MLPLSLFWATIHREVMTMMDMNQIKDRKAITADVPSLTGTGALFAYSLRNKNVQGLFDNQTGHMNPVNGKVRIWGYIGGTIDEWHIIDQFDIVADGPVAQFMTFPLDYDYIYFQEMVGAVDHMNVRLAYNNKRVVG